MRTLPVGQQLVRFDNFKSKDLKITEVPINKEPKPIVNEKGKKTTLLTTAIAVASLGISMYAISKNRNGAKAVGEALEGKVEGAARSIEALEKKLGELKSEIVKKPDSVGEEVVTKLEKLVGEIEQLKASNSTAALNAKVEELFNFVERVNSKVSNTKGFFNEMVEVNGNQMTLATVLNQVEGSARSRMESTLRTESIKRMLGLGKPLEKLPEGGMIRIPTSEYKGYASTGGMSIVPKEIAQNLAEIIAGRQNIRIGIDLPLYRGNVEKSEIKGVYTRLFNDLRLAKDGKYEYVQTKIKDGEKPVESILARLEKINTMNLKITTENGVENQVVDVLLGENKLPLNYKKIAERLSPELLEKIKKLGLNESLEFGTLVVERDGQGVLNAHAKIKTIFYDNGKGGKFDLNVPVDKAKDIYNNKAISAGETERFIYFDKFFYEQMLRNEESKAPLSADMILGNDWQTGPIAAMSRLLTTVNKEYGMNPVLADKIYNTPIVVVLHNAELAGGNWQAQERLLNVLFGEQAATIVKNAHMPNISLAGKTEGLGANLFNGLMEGSGVSPQMMAVSYADYILPVSKGYSKEIAHSDVLGGPRRKLFEFRAREGVYGELENLKDIAARNNIRSELINEVKPTMIGVTNGCDRANNTLTETNAKKLAEALNLPEGTFQPYVKGIDELAWHNANKKAGLEKIRVDIDTARLSGGKNNPMQIEMPELTDLTGVTEKTPVFVSAGRIVDQKGLDIFADSIVEFYKNFKGGEYPVFYVQGIGEAKYKEAVLLAKQKVAETNPDAAKRIVFANLFSEPGRYDCSKLIADWSVMPSWFEPCGLSHKEIAQYSGAGAVVNRTGGLIDGLKEGVNVIASEFSPYRHDKAKNAQNFAKALEEAVNIHADENRYRAVVKEMMNANFDWAREGGPIYEYMAIFEDLGVLSKEVAKASK